MAQSRDEIMEKVREALVEALGVDEDEVSGTAKIGSDLGAESIDYLDIVFRLEKAFNIKIPRGDLFPDNILSSEEFVQDNKLTAKGLAELKVRMPHADLAAFEKNPNVQDIADLFTVDMIVRYIESKLGSPGMAPRDVPSEPSRSRGPGGKGSPARGRRGGARPGSIFTWLEANGEPMRWIWIDKFVAFEPGRRAVTIKNVTLAEEHLHDHFPGYPIHPPTLMIEGMAQTGGAGGGRVRFPREGHPGEGDARDVPRPRPSGRPGPVRGGGGRGDSAGGSLD